MQAQSRWVYLSTEEPSDVVKRAREERWENKRRTDSILSIKRTMSSDENVKAYKRNHQETVIVYPNAPFKFGSPAKVVTPLDMERRNKTYYITSFGSTISVRESDF